MTKKTLLEMKYSNVETTMEKDPRYIKGFKLIDKARKETRAAENEADNFWELERALQVANILMRTHARIECSSNFDDSDEFEDHTGHSHDAYIEMIQESAKEADAQVVEACVKVSQRKVNLIVARKREAEAQKVWLKTIEQLEEELTE